MAMPHTVRRFTLEEYHRMGETGVLPADARVELIDGQVVEMSPIGRDHASCVIRLTDILARQAAAHVSISVQNPLILNDLREYQPDVVALTRRDHRYGAALPTAADALLVIEVGDSSVSFDRTTKIPAYAAALVPEAWLVDLPSDRVEVYRDPEGGSYQTVAIANRGATVTPLALPQLHAAVSEILGTG